ncbi:MAG: NAD(P)/FAD-dependent oxidoreductase [Roseibacillus sp.]
MPVLLHEAGSYPRHRLCGEFVNGVSDETLAALGLGSLMEGAEVHEEMTWWLREEQIARATLAKPVPALSRWEMDRRMSSLFQELGGELRCRSREACQPREGLVWAAGRKIQKKSEWLGLKAHFIGLKTCSGLEMHLGDEGYVGLTPVEEGRVNVCGLFRRREGLQGRGSERFLAQLKACGLGELVARLRESKADEASVTGVSGIGFGAQGHPSELLAVGDAERMIPPFTGNGMSMAFEAAESALEPLCHYAGGDAGWATTRELVQSRLESRFRRRIALAKGMHGFILKSPAQEALAAIAKPGLLPFSFLTRLLT